MEAKKEKKKRQPNPYTVKPCGFRVDVGEEFYCISRDISKDELFVAKRKETEQSRYSLNKKGERVENKSSINGIIAENGNYFRTAEDCQNRIDELKKRKTNATTRNNKSA